MDVLATRQDIFRKETENGLEVGCRCATPDELLDAGRGQRRCCSSSNGSPRGRSSQRPVSRLEQESGVFLCYKCKNAAAAVNCREKACRDCFLKYTMAVFKTCASENCQLELRRRPRQRRAEKSEQLVSCDKEAYDVSKPKKKAQTSAAQTSAAQTAADGASPSETDHGHISDRLLVMLRGHTSCWCLLRLLREASAAELEVLYVDLERVVPAELRPLLCSLSGFLAPNNVSVASSKQATSPSQPASSRCAELLFELSKMSDSWKLRVLPPLPCTACSSSSSSPALEVAEMAAEVGASGTSPEVQEAQYCSNCRDKERMLQRLLRRYWQEARGPKEGTLGHLLDLIRYRAIMRYAQEVRTSSVQSLFERECSSASRNSQRTPIAASCQSHNDFNYNDANDVRWSSTDEPQLTPQAEVNDERRDARHKAGNNTLWICVPDSADTVTEEALRAVCEGGGLNLARLTCWTREEEEDGVRWLRPLKGLGRKELCLFRYFDEPLELRKNAVGATVAGDVWTRREQQHLHLGTSTACSAAQLTASSGQSDQQALVQCEVNYYCHYDHDSDQEDETHAEQYCVVDKGHTTGDEEETSCLFHELVQRLQDEKYSTVSTINGVLEKLSLPSSDLQVPRCALCFGQRDVWSQRGLFDSWSRRQTEVLRSACEVSNCKTGELGDCLCYRCCRVVSSHPLLGQFAVALLKCW